MKLTELRPRYDAGSWLSFDCPKCKERLAVPVRPTPDGSAPDPRAWDRTGDTFETLTISPSIDSHHVLDDGTKCNWHGFIRNGEILTC